LNRFKSEGLTDMRCRSAQHHFEAYVDAALTPRQHRAVEAHLAKCSRCQHAWQQRQQLQQAMQAGPTPALPAGFAQHVMTAVHERGDGQREGQSWRYVPFPGTQTGWAWPTRLAAAAGLAIGLFLGAAMGVNTPASIYVSPRGQTPQQQAPQTTDPATAYKFDALSGAPEGSLVSTYLGAGTNPGSQEAS
jgi:anti-sigma factor RsiW